jgi:hypothetical protein
MRLVRTHPGAPAAWLSALAIILLGSLVLAPFTPGAESLRLIFHHSPAETEFGTVDLAGLNADAVGFDSWENLAAEDRQEQFACYTEQAAAHEGWPAVLGSYEASGEVIRFRPRYPFSAGGVYTCRFLPEKLRAAGGKIPLLQPITLTFTMPSPERPAPARVTAVYPAGPTVPENLLRLYIHFSTPMQRKDVQDHVRLFNSRGEEVDLPFVEVEHGLWDTGSRRLTLFFHPGRIKRGVGPHDSMGPPLQAGEKYRLVVDEGLQDARGYPLASSFHKEFVVIEADRRSPDPAGWMVEAPRSSRDGVSLQFHESLDHALVGRFIRVQTAGGEVIQGQVTVHPDGSGWSFVPARPWDGDTYTVVVNPALEDLAGNTPGYLFDEKTGTSSHDRPGPDGTAEKAEPIEISFSVPSR